MKRKNLLLLYFLLCCCLSLSAQVNPKRGYIITLQGDTISGTIDYRTDGRNAANCLFRKDGEAAFTNYSPQQISAYRLADNGAFYVSRTFPVDGVQKTFFAEYLVKGGVSLFHLSENARDYYFFVDNGGEVAVYKPEVETSSHLAKDIAREKRHKMAGVLKKFNRSPETIEQLFLAEESPYTFSQITREYDERYCQDAGECVQYLFDAGKTRSVETRFRVEAGVATASLTGERYQFRSDMKFSTLMPQVAVGLDFLLPRTHRGLAVETQLAAGYISDKGELEKEFYDPDGDYRLKALNFQWQLGAAFNFRPEQRLSPLVRGGLIVSHMIKMKDSDVTDFYMNGSASLASVAGFYLGAGADLKTGHHVARLSASVQAPIQALSQKGKLLKRHTAVLVSIGLRV